MNFGLGVSFTLRPL